MKNVFVLPTDKPSRVYLIKSNNRLGLTSTNPEYMENFGSGTQNQHLYITSDEEIKDCFVINIHTNQVYFLEGYYGVQPRTKKIILTTDGDLIKEGVQSIDDEFLQWYIKNPSCEEVDYCNWNEYYKITPKEDVKKELPQTGTIEFVNMCESIFGGKPKKEQDRNKFSKEDMEQAFIAGVDKESYNGVNFDVWFEQFKNKL